MGAEGHTTSASRLRARSRGAIRGCDRREAVPGGRYPIAVSLIKQSSDVYITKTAHTTPRGVERHPHPHRHPFDDD